MGNFLITSTLIPKKLLFQVPNLLLTSTDKFFVRQLLIYPAEPLPLVFFHSSVLNFCSINFQFSPTSPFSSTVIIPVFTLPCNYSEISIPATDILAPLLVNFPVLSRLINSLTISPVKSSVRKCSLHCWLFIGRVVMQG